MITGRGRHLPAPPFCCELQSRSLLYELYQRFLVVLDISSRRPMSWRSTPAQVAPDVPAAATLPASITRLAACTG
ncbi:hypothetical protein BBK82_31520 [Lentzea guizhouensis]|uniref:Uncharacterized protein n=1 Tax=Lentzea guizhouensis TaxID=1586287 RepID=A0A1B2HQA0_9PSEU|nr:hypothetical protein BBK82_31520 [Lentzea guizhouensis]